MQALVLLLSMLLSVTWLAVVLWNLDSPLILDSRILPDNSNQISPFLCSLVSLSRSLQFYPRFPKPCNFRFPSIRLQGQSRNRDSTDSVFRCFCHPPVCTKFNAFYWEQTIPPKATALQYKTKQCMTLLGHYLMITEYNKMKKMLYAATNRYRPSSQRDVFFALSMSAKAAGWKAWNLTFPYDELIKPIPLS